MGPASCYDHDNEDDGGDHDVDGSDGDVYDDDGEENDDDNADDDVNPHIPIMGEIGPCFLS